MLEYRGGNPLVASSWYKFPNPIFQRSDANGVYGPGHHSFFTSPERWCWRPSRPASP
jgi:GH43 family beta-xylosidase